MRPPAARTRYLPPCYARELHAEPTEVEKVVELKALWSEVEKISAGLGTTPDLAALASHLPHVASLGLFKVLQMRHLQRAFTGPLAVLPADAEDAKVLEAFGPALAATETDARILAQIEIERAATEAGLVTSADIPALEALVASLEPDAWERVAQSLADTAANLNRAPTLPELIEFGAEGSAFPLFIALCRFRLIQLFRMRVRGTALRDALMAQIAETIADAESMMLAVETEATEAIHVATEPKSADGEEAEFADLLPDDMPDLSGLDEAFLLDPSEEIDFSADPPAETLTEDRLPDVVSDAEPLESADLMNTDLGYLIDLEEIETGEDRPALQPKVPVATATVLSEFASLPLDPLDAIDAIDALEIDETYPNVDPFDLEALPDVEMEAFASDDEAALPPGATVPAVAPVQALAEAVFALLDELMQSGVIALPSGFGRTSGNDPASAQHIEELEQRLAENQRALAKIRRALAMLVTDGSAAGGRGAAGIRGRSVNMADLGEDAVDAASARARRLG